MFDVVFADKVIVDNFAFYLHERKITQKHNYAWYKLRKNNNIDLLVTLNTNACGDVSQTFSLAINDLDFNVSVIKTKNNYQIFYNEDHDIRAKILIKIKWLYKIIKHIPQINNAENKDNAIAELLLLFNGKYLKKVSIGSFSHRRYEQIIADVPLTKRVVRTVANRFPSIKNEILDLFNYQKLNSNTSGKTKEDLFFEDLTLQVKNSGATVTRQYPVKYKGKAYRLDFLVQKEGKVINIEHDGNYHKNRYDLDSLRDKQVKAALLYDFIDGVEIMRVAADEESEQHFLTKQLPKLLRWLTSDSQGLNWYLDKLSYRKV